MKRTITVNDRNLKKFTRWFKKNKYRLIAFIATGTISSVAVKLILDILKKQKIEKIHQERLEEIYKTTETLKNPEPVLIKMYPNYLNSKTPEEILEENEIRASLREQYDKDVIEGKVQEGKISFPKKSKDAKGYAEALKAQEHAKPDFKDGLNTTSRSKRKNIITKKYYSKNIQTENVDDILDDYGDSPGIKPAGLLDSELENDAQPVKRGRLLASIKAIEDQRKKYESEQSKKYSKNTIKSPKSSKKK